MGIDQEDYFMFVDVGDKNSNKVWRIIREGSEITTKWGRVGDSLQSKTWSLGSEDASKKEYDKKCREKIRKGYEKVDVIGKASIESGKDVRNSELASVALQEIHHDNDATKDLIKYLSEQNIHSILEHTTMQYNITEGVFTTPLGIVVSQSTIDRARTILAEIKSKQTPDINSLTNQYLRLIPQNLGRARDKLSVERVWNLNNTQAFLLKIQQQADVLDSLEASLKTVLTQPEGSGNIEKPKVFDCKLHLVIDTGIIDEINKLYKLTWQAIHESSKFEVKKVYTVDIAAMRSAWESDGAKLSNIQTLWHGTKPSNVLSIMKKGLIIPPANANYVAGRMFGNGCYFSDQSTKSLNYSYGYWDGNHVNRCFMFLADVAMGKSYTPKSSYESLPKAGYDSTFAKARESGILNNEMVIYRLSQANLVYLVEFEK